MVVAVALFPPAAAAATASISITSTLELRDLTVAVGTLVTWTNNDGDRHRMRTTSGPVEFDSGNLDSGESFSFTFDLEGTYLYMDDRDRDNSGYYGTIIVAAEAPRDPGDPPPPPPPAGDVRIVDDTFRPGSITVNVGGTVTWSNQDREHTVTARDRSWDSGVFDAGQTYTKVFDSPGSFEYFCVIHPDMVATVLVTGDGGTPPPPPPPLPPPPPPPEAGDISIVDNDFDPATRTVTVGATVRWVNTGQIPHTVTASGIFDSGILMSGDAWSRTFNSAGTFSYICTLHPEMTATIVVTGGEGDPPPPPSPPPGEDPPPPPGEDPPPPPPGGAISIVDNDYSPRSRTIGVGSTVSWVNTGQLPHTVTAAGQFDSGLLMSGDAWSRTFNSAGTFDYICTLHPEMTATIVVTAGDGTPPPPPEDPPPPPPGEDPPPPPPTRAISIVDNDYSPRSRTVAVGSTVSWVNTGVLPHTVTAAGQFDSRLLMSGDTWSRTFNSPGTFDYICTLHPEMTGSIVVTGSGSGTSDIPEGSVTDPTSSLLDSGDAAFASQPAASSPELMSVNMVDNAYDPDLIEVQVGDSITWTNAGELPHTVTARDESFDSGFLMAGDTWTMQFNQVGEFEYFCTIHPEMVATIRVNAPSADPARSESGLEVGPATPNEDPDLGSAADPVAAGVSGSTEASIIAILFIVLLTVGFIVYLVHEVDFAPLPDSEQD
jgi:plastocyanin